MFKKKPESFGQFEASNDKCDLPISPFVPARIVVPNSDILLIWNNCS